MTVRSILQKNVRCKILVQLIQFKMHFLCPILQCLFFVSSVSISSALAGDVTESALQYRPFGAVKIFRDASAPKSLVLLVSGRDGWTTNLTQASRSLVASNVVIAGIDLTTYQKHIDGLAAKCSYPSGDLENLSKFIQAELKFSDYELPIVIGYDDGASLAYGSFFQAPENTFMAAIGMGFCPRYAFKKTMCDGEGMRSVKDTSENSYKILSSSRNLPGWTTIKVAGAKNCLNEDVNQFTQSLKNAKMMTAEDNGEKTLVDVVRDILKKIPAQNLHPGGVENLKELPLIIVEPEKIARGKNEYFAIFYSGDGGWAGFDKDLSAELNKRGVPVVGLSTLSYFWKAKSPDTCAVDLKKIIEVFQAKWGIKKVVLLGYSFGADILPFLVSRLSADLQKEISLISLMSPSGFGEFEFKFGHWLSSSGTDGLPMSPEMNKIKSKVRIQCLFGVDQKKPFCKTIDNQTYQVVQLPGGHRFDGNWSNLTDIIQSGFFDKAPLKD